MCVKKIDEKFSTVCKENEKCQDPLVGIFFDSHCRPQLSLSLSLSLSFPVGGRVTAPIDSRKDHMRQGSVESM